MNYPIVIHKDEDSDFGVVVPDLPGCYTAGSTIDEAMAMAREAIELHLEGLVEEGQAVPKPGAIADYQSSLEYAGGIWALVSVDAAALRLRVKRINITMPERVLEAVDRYARARNKTRSGILVQAVTTYMGREVLRPAKGRTRRIAQRKRETGRRTSKK